MNVNLELEAVTPIFMRGADQSKMEIRAASIKGLMRWWFRALAGNYFGGNVIQLKEAESYVFGSTELRSRVDIIVSNVNQRPKRLIFNTRRNPRGKLVPNFDRNSHLAELSYLWFSIKLQTEEFFKKDIGPKYRWNKARIDSALEAENIFFYPSNTKFSVEIRSQDEKALKLALISFWALVSLGGVGFRNRRGAGSLIFADGDLHIFEDMGLKTRFRKLDDFKASISNSIRFLGDYLPEKRDIIHNLTPKPYAILNNQTSYVGLVNFVGCNDPILCLSNFGREYQNFRKNRQNFLRRVIFGLPIVKSNIKGYNLKSKRRASPMLVGITYIEHKPHIRLVKFITDPYYQGEDDDVNSIAQWNTLKDFNSQLDESKVFGNLEVFR